MGTRAVVPAWLVVDPFLRGWLLEDIGRGDRTTQGIFPNEAPMTQAVWVAKQSGVVAGLPVARRIFHLLDPEVRFVAFAKEGECCPAGEKIASIAGPADILLMGERVALNVAMRLSGVATMARRYVEAIADLSCDLVDTRKTTPGLRLLEKYAMQVGGARNHRMGLDDAVMVKENHIAAAGGIAEAIARVRRTCPYPLSVEVETENLEEVRQAIAYGADIVMLDNMPPATMREAVALIREASDRIRIEASGNITLETIRAVAETGVDYISTSAPITCAPWLDLSMRFEENL